MLCIYSEQNSSEPSLLGSLASNFGSFASVSVHIAASYEGRHVGFVLELGCVHGHTARSGHTT